VVELPYSVEVLFAVQAAYNAAWFPLAPGMWLLTLLAVALTRRRSDRPLAGSDPAGRIIATILGAGWILSGLGQQIVWLRELDFLALWYGIGLILQGALLAILGGALGRLHWRAGTDAVGLAGLTLAFAGLVLHPLAILAAGQDAASLPLAGTAPDATAIVTAGMLLLLRPSPPLYLFALPLAWASVATVSGWLLDFWPDGLVLPAVLIAIAVAIRQRLAAR
jgi:hypothetical protein